MLHSTLHEVLGEAWNNVSMHGPQETGLWMGTTPVNMRSLPWSHSPGQLKQYRTHLSGFCAWIYHQVSAEVWVLLNLRPGPTPLAIQFLIERSHHSCWVHFWHQSSQGGLHGLSTSLRKVWLFMFWPVFPPEWSSGYFMKTSWMLGIVQCFAWLFNLHSSPVRRG
jgi:hypothetical protein